MPTIKGTKKADIIRGSSRDDSVWAGAGDDLVYGGAGNDILRGEDGDDDVFGELGNDRITGGNGSDYLDGGAGDDWISDAVGNVGDINHMLGGEGQDSIYGGQRVDYLYGDAGNDRLGGFVGADHLYGGADADTFLYSEAANSTTGTPTGGLAGLSGGVDVIYDFSAPEGDRIDLSEVDAIDSSPYDQLIDGNNDGFTYVGTEVVGANHSPGDLTISYENGMTIIRGYVDGDQTADLVINLINPTGITIPIVSPGDIFY